MRTQTLGSPIPLGTQSFSRFVPPIPLISPAVAPFVQLRSSETELTCSSSSLFSLIACLSRSWSSPVTKSSSNKFTKVASSIRPSRSRNLETEGGGSTGSEVSTSFVPLLSLCLSLRIADRFSPYMNSSRSQWKTTTLRSIPTWEMNETPGAIDPSFLSSVSSFNDFVFALSDSENVSTSQLFWIPLSYDRFTLTRCMKKRNRTEASKRE